MSEDEAAPNVKGERKIIDSVSLATLHKWHPNIFRICPPEVVREMTESRFFEIVRNGVKDWDLLEENFRYVTKKKVWPATEEKIGSFHAKLWPESEDNCLDILHPVRFNTLPINIPATVLFVKAASMPELRRLVPVIYDVHVLWTTDISTRGWLDIHDPTFPNPSLNNYIGKGLIEITSMKQFELAFSMACMLISRTMPWNRSMEPIQFYLIMEDWFVHNTDRFDNERNCDQAKYCQKLVEYLWRTNGTRFASKRPFVMGDEIPLLVDLFNKQHGYYVSPCRVEGQSKSCYCDKKKRQQVCINYNKGRCHAQVDPASNSCRLDHWPYSRLHVCNKKKENGRQCRKNHSAIDHNTEEVD